MFYLNLNDLEFMACHGVLAEEKVTPQKFVVDVKVETDLVTESALTDNIDDALNYVGIYELITQVMTKEQYDLIETIAMRISQEIVNNYEDVVSVDVKVTKVNPPIPGFSGTVSCEYAAFGTQ